MLKRCKRSKSEGVEHKVGQATTRRRRVGFVVFCELNFAMHFVHIRSVARLRSRSLCSVWQWDWFSG
jgi:hypothetical protein